MWFSPLWDKQIIIENFWDMLKSFLFVRLRFQDMKPVFWAFSIYQYEQQATVRPDLPTAPYIIPKMSFIAISNFSLKGESLEEIFDEAGDSKSLLKVKSYNHFSLNHQTYGTVQTASEWPVFLLETLTSWCLSEEAWKFQQHLALRWC